MVLRCPSCGSDNVRGSKTDLPEGATLYDRRCNACGLLEARRDTERDLARWLGTWESDVLTTPSATTPAGATSAPAPKLTPDTTALADVAVDATEAALLHAVTLDPDADEPRRGYAEWLDARGDARGEFIRVQLQLSERARARAGASVLTPLRRRSRELLEVGRFSWQAPVRSLVKHGVITSPMFYRGFLERVAMSMEVFLSRFDDIAKVTPIRFVTLAGVRGRVAELCRAPQLARVRGLNLDRNDLEDADIETLAASPRSSGLRWLSLNYNRGLGLAALESIAGSPHLRGLRYLSFGFNGVNDPKDEVQTDGDAIVFVGKTFTGKQLETRFGELPWLHWPEGFVGEVPDPDAFC